MDAMRNANLNEEQRKMMLQNIKKDLYKEYSDGSATVLNFNTPPQMPFDTAEFVGSMQQILAANIGEYCVIEFLIGTEMIMRKQGVLYHVGVSYLTLYDDQLKNFIVCDLFSIKFVYFYFPGDRPKRNYNQLPMINTGNNQNNQNQNNMNR